MTEPYGVVAEFDDPRKLVDAARAARDEGYKKIEAYSPYPIKELDEIIPTLNVLPAMVFIAGVMGAACAWILQCYIAIVDFPLNIGGRPLYSWPSFVPITFELTILFAACTAFFGALWLCGYPRVHHPVFNAEHFSRASDDSFFLCIQSSDLKFMPQSATEFLQSLSPVSVSQVEDD